ncbi:hypothetical protein COLO4_18006 [Corchorus olitorius]|uniref:Armadillo-like helical n=1 Tax=Corchorus olitorius TaxID=93759 RepID=A0A1R3JAX1_9ROSI|nr:hypothetical protein COLO4_18006 [Corchorus olitorius]
MEKKQEQQSGNKSKKNERKGGSLKIFGSSSINGGDLVGSVIEKGIVSSNSNISKPIQPPQPSVLPFPVARHRSHGPHWTPISNSNVDEEDDEDESAFANFDHISAFAKPVQRKEKKGLNVSLWKELMQSDEFFKSKGQERNKSSLGNSERHRKNGEAMKNVGKKSTSDSLGAHVDAVASMDVDLESHLNAHRLLTKAEEAVRTESNFSSVTEMDLDNSHQLHQEENVKDADSDNFSRESGLMAIDGQESANRIFHIDTANLQTGRLEKAETQSMVPKQFQNFGNEQRSTSLESEIDAENRARLKDMSSEEIAEAQAEIMEKMDPALLNLLKKRGQEKLKKQKHSSSSLAANSLSDRGIICENISSNEINSLNTESSDSQMMTTSSNITKTGVDNGLEQNVGPVNGSLWDAWSQRVEAVRELRFSLDGTVVEKDFAPIPQTSVDNVAERDFLRTEGDPGAAGYTIKEAVALTRSTIPGQRALALHLVASVLDKALCNIYLNPVVSTLANSNKVDSTVDWEAVWAFALGPEPELVLSLRMSLDDNHNSVVLASAKVIQSILSCDLNGNIFDFLEKRAIGAKDTYTAPIFRSKPEIDVGFLHGGFWKYSAKPSNILLCGDNMVDDETEGKHTIQDDVVVGGQDFAAGLIRMGILPRIRYLLEMEPATPLEECLISVLTAIARHSPICANAIMKCQRLVQTIVHRFTSNNNLETYPSKIKSVCFLRVLAQSDRKNCGEFAENRTFRAMTWHLYQNASSLEQWLKMGREQFKLSSALMVEQLRFWKVCIQNGYCVSYFSDIFPALCLWLNPPTVEKLVENNVLGEYASISTEAYLVLESLAGTLPNLYSHQFLSDRVPQGADDNVETWSWSQVGPMVDLAVKWISFKSRWIDSQNGMKGSSVFVDKSFSPLLWVYSAVMHMLSRVLERVIPEDTIGLPEEGGHIPWLPDFVPKVGLEIIRNGFLSFTSVNSAEYGANLGGGVATPVQSVPLIWKLHSLSIILLIGMAVLEEEKSRDVYESLQELYGQLLDETRSKKRPYAAVSFGDSIYGRQVAVYLHRSVESPVRLAAWNALSNSRVLELLPPLQQCLGEAEGYLEPVEENEAILEAYVKSWVSGALDRAVTRGSIAFTLVLHHISSFVFISHRSDKPLLRNKLVKSLLRDYSRKKQHEGMMLEFIQYNKASTFPVAEKREGLPLQKINLEERMEILKEACEGNPSLLKEVEKLKSVLSERLVVS